jgi:hypothetical protein
MGRDEQTQMKKKQNKTNKQKNFKFRNNRILVLV